MINTSAHSYAAQAYPEDIEKVISIMETAIGIGCSLGPVLGSLVYSWLGYAWAFLLFGIAMVPPAVLLLFLKRPRDLVKARDATQADEELISRGDSEALREKRSNVSGDDMRTEGLQKVTYGQLICMPRVIFAALSATMNYIVYCALEPTLTLRLEDYGLAQTQKGLVFTIMPTMYMISCFVAPYCQPKWMETRVWLTLSAFFLGFSMLFVGPFFLEKSLPVMCVGLFFNGCMLGPLIIPNMAEMIVATKLAYPDCDHEHANSLIGGVLNSAYGIGGAVGPIIGTSLYQFVGFRNMCNVVGGVCMVFSILYFVLCSGCEAWRSTMSRRANQGRQMSDIELLSESVYGIRHASKLKGAVISHKIAQAIEQMNWIKRSQSADDVVIKTESIVMTRR